MHKRRRIRILTGFILFPLLPILPPERLVPSRIGTLPALPPTGQPRPRPLLNPPSRSERPIRSAQNRRLPLRNPLRPLSRVSALRLRLPCAHPQQKMLSSPRRRASCSALLLPRDVCMFGQPHHRVDTTALQFRLCCARPPQEMLPHATTQSRVCLRA
jgi:hypothetical protein